MTEKEAIEALKIAIAEVEWNYPIDYAVAFEEAIKALEEVQEYRKIGTLEEVRNAVEKQNAKKPLGGMDICGNEYRICHYCSAIVEDGEWRADYCPDCGRKQDWSGEND